MSNDEIANLHAKLSQQNSEHQQQLRELRAMYETKINELQVSCFMLYISIYYTLHITNVKTERKEEKPKVEKRKDSNLFQKTTPKQTKHNKTK